MNFFELIKIALRSLISNKMRSFLTMLGIIIGVGAVITMMSVGEGAQQEVANSISNLGSNLLFVKSGRSGGMGGASSGSGSARVLTADMAQQLLVESTTIARLAPEISGTVTISSGNEDIVNTVSGTTEDYLIVQNGSLLEGRFIDQNDLERKSRVAVLGAEIAFELFGSQDPVGERIRIDRKTFEVIGLLAPKGGGMSQTSVDDLVFIPLTTAEARVIGTKYLNSIYVSAKSADLVSEAETEVNEILTQITGNPDSFFVRNMSSVLESMSATTQTFTFLLAGVAAVSLLVGGIGIMNIMLVSVTERTKEIGLRMAVGAAQKDVLLQFIVEAIVMSLAGGILGISFGIAASSLIANLGGWPVIVSSESIILAVSFSLIIGLFFGIWPANKASRLDPIEALRYE